MDSAAPVGQTAAAYHVFISYSRRDIEFARALDQALRRYVPPPGLGLPRRALAVFRDESDFTGTEYFAAVQAHLEGSRKLVLLCSPAAAGSSFVGDEVRRFGEMRSSSDIVPVLVAGLPNNEVQPAHEASRAFPQALLDLQPLPLAADFRGFAPGRDSVTGRRYRESWHKLLADLLDRSRAEIDQREQRRRRERVAWGGAATLALVAAATGSAQVWWQQRLEAEAADLWQGLAGNLAESAPALVKIGQLDRSVHLAFVDAALGSPVLAARALEDPEVVVRSIVGLSSTRRAAVLARLAAGAQEKDPVFSSLTLALALHLHDPAAVPPALQAVRRATDRVQRGALVDGLRRAAPGLTSADGAAAAAQAVAWVVGPPPSAAEVPMHLLATAPFAWTAAQSAMVADAVVGQIAKSTDTDTARSDVASLKALGQRWSPEAREHAAAHAVSVLPQATAEARRALHELVSEWGSARTAGVAAEASLAVAEQATADTWGVIPTLRLLTALPPAVSSDHAARASAAAAAAMSRTGTPSPDAARRNGQRMLGTAQQALSARLGPETVAVAESPWLDLLRASAVPSVIEAAARALQAGPVRSAAARPGEVDRVLLAAMSQPTEVEALAAVVTAWARRAPDGPLPASAAAALRKLLAAIEAKPESKSSLASLAALETLAPRLSAADAAAAANQLLAALSRDPPLLLGAVHDDGVPPVLRSGGDWASRALAALARVLTAPDAARAAARMSAVILRLDDPAAARDLAAALPPLLRQARVAPGDALDATLREAWTTSSRPAALAAHAWALAQTGLGGILDDPRATVRRLVAVRPGLVWNAPWELSSEALREVLKTLPPSVQSEAAGEVVTAMRQVSEDLAIKRLVSMLSFAVDLRSLPAGREALAVVVEKVEQARNESSLVTLVEAMAKIPLALDVAQAQRVGGRVLRDWSAVPSPVLGETVAQVVARLPTDAAAAVLTFEAMKAPWIPGAPFARAWQQRLAPRGNVDVPHEWWPLAQWGRERFASSVDFDAPMATPEVIQSRLKVALAATS